MTRNCKNCFWSTYWGEADIEYICERGWLCFDEALAECLKDEPCKEYMSLEEAERILGGDNDE